MSETLPSCPPKNDPAHVLSIGCIRPRGGGQLRLPFIPIRQQLLLVIQQLLPGLGGILGIGALDDGIDGAAFLAEAAVDAFGHVDVVAGGSAGAVLALFGLDGDGAGGADGLAELAGDATFFSRGVAAQGVFAPEPGRDGAFFEGVVDCVSVFVRVRFCVPFLRCGVPSSGRGLMGRGDAHGGRKNCSSTTYMPRNISVRRK